MKKHKNVLESTYDKLPMFKKHLIEMEYFSEYDEPYQVFGSLGIFIRDLAINNIDDTKEYMEHISLLFNKGDTELRTCLSTTALEILTDKRESQIAASNYLEGDARETFLEFFERGLFFKLY